LLNSVSSLVSPSLHKQQSFGQALNSNPNLHSPINRTNHNNYNSDIKTPDPSRLLKALLQQTAPTDTASHNDSSSSSSINNNNNNDNSGGGGGGADEFAAWAMEEERQQQATVLANSLSSSPLAGIQAQESDFDREKRLRREREQNVRKKRENQIKSLSEKIQQARTRKKQTKMKAKRMEEIKQKLVAKEQDLLRKQHQRKRHRNVNPVFESLRSLLASSILFVNCSFYCCVVLCFLVYQGHS
jgi:hypothetical protein